MAGVDINFLDWMLYGVPSALFLLLPVWGVLLLFFRPEMKHLKKSKEDLRREFDELPSMSREERVTTGNIFAHRHALGDVPPVGKNS